MSFGDASKTIVAARLKIFRADVEITLATDVRAHPSRILDRTNTRAGGVDAPRWKIEDLEFTALATQLLKAQIQEDFKITAASALNYNNWKVVGLSKSGTAADNLDDVYNCTVIDHEDLGPENGMTLMRVKLRVEPTDG